MDMDIDMVYFTLTFTSLRLKVPCFVPTNQPAMTYLGSYCSTKSERSEGILLN